ncbi:MAG TPA: NAD-dependent succinate-semialdehyde dehydrogenase [Acidimicrobiia bacterium]|nr:NAD-dependent succinate-semialdehyde dehydrogenase [Acidimicrobiia bacterium]
MMEYRQYIGGEWTGAIGGGTWELVNPATEETIDLIPFGDGADAKAAVDAAAGAATPWAAKTAYERAAILAAAADLIESRADQFALVTTEESGKPLAQSKAEWLSCPNYFRWAAEEAKRVYGRWIPSRIATRRIDVTYRPVGIVGLITAWNFPVYNQARAISSALAAGCTVVSRPSEYTPRSAMLIAACLEEAGLPPGVLNILNGEAHPMGQVFLDDPRVRKISFTGSTRVGKLLMEGASRTVTRLALEMGGNAPVLIFPDAGEVDRLATDGVTAKVRNAGQVCVAPQRFYVHRQLGDDFTEAAVAAAQNQVVGDGSDPATTIGPLINATQRERVERIVAETVEQGGAVRVGGARLDRPGYFYQPTVVTEVKPGSPLHEEEVFGPVLPITEFSSVAEVVEMANSTEYGLAAYIHTRDIATALAVSEQLDYGMVAINDWYVATPEAPFGGMKQSGLGRESGSEGVYEYLEPKTRYFGGIG